MILINFLLFITFTVLSVDKVICDTYNNFNTVLNKKELFNTEILQDISDQRQLQETSCSDITFDDEIFQDRTFDISSYVTYDGLDFTALFASSIDMTDRFIVVGSNGYNLFKGIVHVYEPISEIDFGTHFIIRSPTHDNANFGTSVAVDGETILVSANGYNLYDGIVFSYSWTLDTYWRLEDKIESPLQGLNIAQGFGYRVDLSGNFAIISTAVNNAYIYERTNSKQWVLNTDLTPPADDVRFGRSVAIHGDVAIVGATGVGGSEGAAYIYRKYTVNSSYVYWDLEVELQSVLGYSSYFGYSVAIDSQRAVVGATGFRSDVWDSRGQRLANNTGWVYVYDYDATSETWSNYTLIESPVGDDGSFGASLALDNNSILVGADGFPCGSAEGASFLFRLDDSNDQRRLQSSDGASSWSLNRSYPSIDGVGSHFGWQVAISHQYIALGAYGYDDLRGSIHLAGRTVPQFSDAPSPAPSAAPTDSPTGIAAGLNIGGGNPDEDEDLQLGLIVALFLAVLLAAIATGATIWCCCCLAVPIVAAKKKKKKKKEEENSPYTVHSYRGYAETDEYEYSEYEPTLITETYMPAPPMKKTDKTVKFMDEESFRAAYPYKVYGPRGYQEGQNMDEDDLVRMKVEMNGDKDLKMRSIPPPSAAEMHDHRRTHHHHHYHSQPPSMYSTGSSMGESYYSTGSSQTGDDATEYSDEFSRSYSDQSHIIYTSDNSRTEGFSKLSSSQQSKINEARAKYRAFKERSNGSLSSSNGGVSSMPSSHSSLVSSLVESARARGREIARMASETSGEVVSAEDRSIVSGSCASDQSSLVNEARARYASITEKLHQESSSESGAVSSDHAVMRATSLDESSSMNRSAQSLVQAAKARYAALGRRISSRSIDESDDRSKYSADSNNSKGSGSMIDQARARYRSIRGIHRSDSDVNSFNVDSSKQEESSNTTPGPTSQSVHSSGTSMVPQFGGASVSSTANSSMDVQSSSTAAMGKKISPNSERIRNARESAMSKFALYKAKAEEEARKRSYEESKLHEQLILERRRLEEVEKLRSEEDDMIEKAVEEARLRAEQSEIEARAAAKARVEEEHLTKSEKRLREREEHRLIAQERARANFAKFKAESVSGSSVEEFNTIDSDTNSSNAARRALLAARERMEQMEQNLAATRQTVVPEGGPDHDELQVQHFPSTSTFDNVVSSGKSTTEVVTSSRVTTSSHSSSHQSQSMHTYSTTTAGQNHND